MPAIPNPDGRQMRAYERAATERIYAALQRWGAVLTRGLTPGNVTALPARIGDDATLRPLRDDLIALLQEVAEAGAEFGQVQIEQSVYGVKQAAPEVDWTLANSDAAQWAIDYGYVLIRGIVETTRSRVAREIRYFVDNSITINQLRDRLMAGNLFSRQRAAAIAVTEVTRAYAEGNMAAWRASGVVAAREWQTAVDERVCPLCGPLHGKIARMGEPFPFGGQGPPRHVRCRCWIVPVVVGDDEVLV